MAFPKITFIGAGSTVFAKALIGDILSYPELAGSRLSLFDIDAERLATTDAVARRIAATLGVRPQIESTTERARALEGADYAINMIQVGGYRPCTVTDFEIPKRYGLEQTIADTLGIGGIMRALRTIPVLIEMCRDMERLCPEVLHLNYANPMAMNCWGIARASRIRTLGLCHSVPHTAGELAQDLGLPAEEIDYLVAGINHLAFYLKLEHKGEDLYPRLQQLVAEGRVPSWNRVRYEMLRRLGYFVTEVERAFQRVCAVVHQARPARPDRALQHPARRVSAPLRTADRRVGRAAPQARGPEPAGRGPAERRVRPDHHP